MADFPQAYEAMILDEGGYQLSDKKADRGGLTYAGISRVMNPQWEGWAAIDRGETPPTPLVRTFYQAGYWQPLQADAIDNQAVAASLFNFAVNTSTPGTPKVAVKLAQIVLGVTPDGVLGPKTLAALNAYQPELFLARYALARIARHLEICKRDRTQVANLVGWVDRDLRSA